MALQLALKTELIQKFALNPWLIPFFLAFALVAQFILPLPDLLSGGGDATSIWQTIITFRNEKITSSYVLYKGFLSVYPYIWFYELSIFWGLDPFFFIKIYHSLLFSFVAAIGIPYLVSKILNIKINIYKSVIFVVVLFSLTKFTHIYSMLMVDLPSAAFFVGAMCAVYLSYGFNSIWRIVALLLSGLMVGLTLSSSGQYSLAGYLLAIYVVVSIVDSRNLFVKYGNVKIILIMLIFSFGIAVPRVYDAHFEKTIVQPMRDRGEWLPTGRQWLASGLTTSIARYKPFSHPSQSNRGLAILKDHENDNFSKRFELILQGGGSYSFSEYFVIVRKYVFNFFILWTTKFFLALSFDDGQAKISHLLASYTSLFVCLWLVIHRCKRVHDIFNKTTLLVFSMFSILAAPVILHIEMRYAVSLFSLLVGFAVHQEELTNSMVKNASQTLKSLINHEPNDIYTLNISCSVIAYIAFLMVSFTLYGALLEITGSDPGQILFEW